MIIRLLPLLPLIKPTIMKEAFWRECNFTQLKGVSNPPNCDESGPRGSVTGMMGPFHFIKLQILKKKRPRRKEQYV